MNLNPAPTTHDLELSPYGFHLLSGGTSEDNCTLSVDYDGDHPPLPEEIDAYLFKYIQEYALSRWFERVTFSFDATGFISPVDGEDWSGEKIIKARGGSCPIYFIEDADEFKIFTGLTTQEDILVVFVGGIDIRGAFFPFIDAVLEKMLHNTNELFRNKELRAGVTLEKMLREAAMVFSVYEGGINGVLVNGSIIKGHISYKIMERLKEAQAKNGPKKNSTGKNPRTRETRQSTIERVSYVLRL